MLKIVLNVSFRWDTFYFPEVTQQARVKNAKTSWEAARDLVLAKIHYFLEIPTKNTKICKIR